MPHLDHQKKQLVLASKQQSQVIKILKEVWKPISNQSKVQQVEHNVQGKSQNSGKNNSPDNLNITSPSTDTLFQQPKKKLEGANAFLDQPISTHKNQEQSEGVSSIVEAKAGQLTGKEDASRRVGCSQTPS